MPLSCDSAALRVASHRSLNSLQSCCVVWVPFSPFLRGPNMNFPTVGFELERVRRLVLFFFLASYLTPPRLWSRSSTASRRPYALPLRQHTTFPVHALGQSTLKHKNRPVTQAPNTNAFQHAAPHPNVGPRIYLLRKLGLRHPPYCNSCLASSPPQPSGAPCAYSLLMWLVLRLTLVFPTV